jgi:hypothetical protein
MIFLYLKNDVNAPMFPILIRRILMFLVLPDLHLDPLVRVTDRESGSASGSVPKCHGSATEAQKRKDPTDPGPHRIRTKMSRIRNTALHWWSDEERYRTNLLLLVCECGVGWVFPSSAALRAGRGMASTGTTAI